MDTIQPTAETYSLHYFQCILLNKYGSQKIFEIKAVTERPITRGFLKSQYWNIFVV